MLHIHTTVTICNIKIVQVIGVFSIPISGSKTKQSLKNQKKFPIQKLSNHYQNLPKIKTKSQPNLLT